MPLPIISAAERMSRQHPINIAIFGPSGVGKTTLARTLDPAKTLFMDGEAGTLALGDWPGDVLDMRQAAMSMGADPWEFARGLACLLSGPDPADINGPYSRQAYDAYRAAMGEPDAIFGKYDTIFVDSITVCSRWAFAWSARQPEAFSERTGKPDTRGAYGLLGREMVKWLTVLQHAPKSIVVVGILDRFVDDLKRVTFEPQIEGSKAGRELPGIFDQVLTLTTVDVEGGGKARALICHQDNPLGVPAKDRTGKLELYERPDLGALLDKIRNGKRLDAVLKTASPAINCVTETETKE